MLNNLLEVLDKRWARPLDITTVDQAQQALGLGRDDELRWLIYEHLESEPGRLAEKRRFGVSAATVTLTNQEKLAGRALLVGRDEGESREAAGLAPDEWEAAKRMLSRTGLLAHEGWRAAAGHQRLLDGVGLLYHTVSTRGEVFNVP